MPLKTSARDSLPGLRLATYSSRWRAVASGSIPARGSRSETAPIGSDPSFDTSGVVVRVGNGVAVLADSGDPGPRPDPTPVPSPIPVPTPIPEPIPVPPPVPAPTPTPSPPSPNPSPTASSRCDLQSDYVVPMLAGIAPPPVVWMAPSPFSYPSRQLVSANIMTYRNLREIPRPDSRKSPRTEVDA